MRLIHAVAVLLVFYSPFVIGTSLPLLSFQIAGRVEQPIRTIALYYSPKCPHCQKVLAYLHTQNITIPLKDVATDPSAKEELKALGGYLVVPCLIVDGQPIYESDAIIAWISHHQKTIPGNLHTS